MTQLEQSTRAATDERQNPISPRVNDLKVEENQPVNLTIKVYKRQRLHWLIEAKKQGTSLTAAIIEALNGRFGEPE